MIQYRNIKLLGRITRNSVRMVGLITAILMDMMIRRTTAYEATASYTGLSNKHITTHQICNRDSSSYSGSLACITA